MLETKIIILLSNFHFSEKRFKPSSTLFKIDEQDLSQLKDEINNLIKKKSLYSNITSDGYHVKALEYDLYPFELEYFHY